MDIKNIKHIEYLKSTEAVKDSLENLCLFLGEIERIINSEKNDADEIEANKYKLKVLEGYITNMNEVFRHISSEKKDNIIVS